MTKKHEAELKRVHDEHETSDLEKERTIGTLRSINNDLREKVRLLEEGCSTIPERPKKKKDLETQAKDLVNGVISDDSEEEAVEDEAEL